MAERSLLDAPARHPLCPSETVRALGTVVVLAPHADDESLGCGGLLALLADAGQAAHVVVVTDGSRSHPGSKAFPPPRVAALREREAAEAVATLGHAGRVHFLRHADCGLPALDTAAFEAAADRLAALVAGVGADTLVVPWRRDPHCDHEATWQIARARRDPAVRWIEYPVWSWTRPETAPADADATAWRLDISGVTDRKAAAIAAHRSQYAGIVADSPEAFQLPDAMLVHFRRPWELFLDPHDAAPGARERGAASREQGALLDLGAPDA